MGKKKLAVSAKGFDHSTEVARYSDRGISAHVRGWNDGIRVTAYIDATGYEVFEIHTTGGSDNPDVREHIATVKRGRLYSIKNGQDFRLVR
jgi:hypothetical protein